jgi:hypothetical protein
VVRWRLRFALDPAIGPVVEAVATHLPTLRGAFGDESC